MYIKPPKALKCPKDAILLLNKSLYGLKQLGREWYIEAYRGLKSLGFSPYFSEPSVFTTTNRSVIIGLYVDDIVVLGANLRAVQKVI